MVALLPKSKVMILTIGFLLGILTFTAVTKLGKSLTVIWHTIEEYPDVELFGTHSPNELYHKGKDVVAQNIAERVRILCWVLTSPKTHKKAKHVKATWGQRCNILLFMSSETDVSLPTVKLPVRDEYDYLWGKTKQALKYVYDHHLQDADWFFKADDDTYTVVENLRYMLSGFNTSDPLHFGLRFTGNLKNGYMNGGAGYVLSREALKWFVERALYDESKCLQDDFGPEDLELGKCLQTVGVTFVDTRDSYGRGRFFYFAPESYIIPNYLPKDLWYWRFLYYPIKLGTSCCSDTAITFNKVSPSQMHILEYIIYHLRPYGISYHDNVAQGPDMYTEPSSAEGSAGTSLNAAAPGNEKFSHPH